MTAPQAGKKHFEVLDGLRGVAALVVVVFHFMEWIFPDINDNLFGHGFLAVDFFFCLSGFVIGYAYDQRLGQIGVKGFFKARLIRLHPLVIIGSILGLIGLLIDPFAETALPQIGQLALLMLASMLLIPMPLMEDRAFNLFPMNAPAWSLFWEYVANIVYAFVLSKIHRRILVLLTILAAATLCYVSYKAGNLLGGWSKDNILDGGARVAYSFLAGLLVYRSKWMVRNSLGFPLLALLLLAALMMPGTSWNWLTELLLVLGIFPLLVALGAGAVESKRWQSICQLSGKLSYPLYMTHYATIWIFGHYLTTQSPDANTLAIVIVSGVVCMLLFAYLVMRFVDQPIRRYLNSRS